MTGRDLFGALTRALGLYFLFLGLTYIPSLSLWFTDWDRAMRDYMKAELIQAIPRMLTYITLGLFGFFGAGRLARIAYGERNNDSE
jgi:hypothetical protein